MISQLQYFISPGTNPYENIATEEELLMTLQPETCILYLWQNGKTVVIGRNQNPWKECRSEELANEGGFLARRLSGGGAVYHDLGNLNFTFLAMREDYDVKRQLSVILAAVRKNGIEAEISGRNDLEAGGRKFSGNAFYETKDRCLHHGTILIDADREMMKRYLRPSSLKLAGKGVDSVQARVVNLKELNPELTVSKLTADLLASFGTVYGLTPARLFVEDMDIPSLLERRRKFGSVDWVYGKVTEFTGKYNFRGDFGEMYIEVTADRGRISHAKVYSDTMDISLPEKIEAELTGLLCDSPEMKQVLQKYGMREAPQQDAI